MIGWVNTTSRTAVMWEVCFCYIYFWHGLVIQRKNLPDNGAQSCAWSLRKRTFSGSSFSVPGYEGKYADSDRKQHVGKWKVIGKSWLFVAFCYFKAFVSFLKCTFGRKKKKLFFFFLNRTFLQYTGRQCKANGPPIISLKLVHRSFKHHIYASNALSYAFHYLINYSFFPPNTVYNNGLLQIIAARIFLSYCCLSVTDLWGKLGIFLVLQSWDFMLCCDNLTSDKHCEGCGAFTILWLHLPKCRLQN